MEAVWTLGSHISTPATPVAIAIERIKQREHGMCPPEALVAAARPERSEIHALFLWDDERAGELYRLNQARHAIRCIRLVQADGEVDPTPAYLHVVQFDDEGSRSGYMSVADVRRDPVLYEQVLSAAFEQLSNLRRRHQALQELAPVWSAVDKVKERLPGKGGEKHSQGGQGRGKARHG